MMEKVWKLFQSFEIYIVLQLKNIENSKEISINNIHDQNDFHLSAV